MRTFIIVVGSAFALYVILIAFGVVANPFIGARYGEISRGSNLPEVVALPETATTCILTDAYGRTVEVKGDSSDPYFRRLCRTPVQQQVLLYNYPYFFRGFHRHNPGGGGPGGPGSGTGPGTGGGIPGSGTGGGAA